MGDTYPDLPDDELDLAAVLDFSAPGGADEGESPVPVFTVTNPPGSVTVSAAMDGSIRQIELGAGASAMTEGDLADEIVVVARLAAQDARAAQYTMVLEGMRERGHDDAATRDFLSRDLELPSPEQAQAARAQVFSARYPGDHD